MTEPILYTKNEGDLEMLLGRDTCFSVATVPTSIMYAGMLGDGLTFSLIIHFGRPKNLFVPVDVGEIEIEGIKLYPTEITPQKLIGRYRF